MVETKPPTPERETRRRRRGGIGALLRHPLTLYPLLFAGLCLVFLPVLRGMGPALIVFGVLASIFGLIYNLLAIEDEAPRRRGDGPLESSGPESAGRLQGPGLRRALEKAGHSEDLLELHDRYELIGHEVRSALNREGVSEVVRDLFFPAIRQNDQTAIALFNSLVYTQEHLSRLIDTGAKHGEMFEARIAQLRDQRARAMAHLDELVCVLERISVEVPMFSGEPMEEAKRQLERLEDSLDVARKAFKRLEEEQVGDVRQRELD